ncbi:unnamed protein product (macronuclear) [Paramecium tetraurelia]|uniref:Cyclic nucleotide-binding domain-containing protein n=1 Tax=Paramecium tetraurelia TaxID=5888 RepID=A0C3L8_PARTE|nr:uncharacterized protein GSPATT00034864001 [Paramecium tetraurelia]CAK65385.1 unnamed protein product [Paramecium tetraurelia]|eukprot:XP_001432782.1 hypothetical protein (macronuclear) [Paramecium tetraurelia strain d4-2]
MNIEHILLTGASTGRRTRHFSLTKPMHPSNTRDSPEPSLILGFAQPWKENALQIFVLITKFIIKLKQAAEQYRFKLITHRIHNIIGDKASDFIYYQRKGLVKAPFTFLDFITSMIVNKMPSLDFSVIKPDSKFKLIMDLVILVLIIINIFYIPMQLSFQLNNNNTHTSQLGIYKLILRIFLIEILLNFNTAYYSKGMIHESRQKIFKHYVQGEFAYDLIVVIPFLISQYKIPYINFMLLLRITRVKKIFEQIEEISLIREKFAAPIDICKLLYFLILVSHMLGCAWHFVGQIELQNNIDNCWLTRYGYADKDWVVRYIASLYFGTITAFTIGYGDIVPQNQFEQMFVILTVLITSLIFGYTISAIQQIFGQLREKTDQHRNNMATVNSYLKKNKINPLLQMRIRKYFEYFFTLDETQDVLMDHLNEDLKQELKASIFIPKLKQCQLINRFNDSLLAQLSRVVKTQKYIPGQIIFQQGDFVPKAMFLVRGEIESLINKVSIRTQKQGSFGIREFFLRNAVHYTTKATKFSEIAYITHEEFIEVVKRQTSNYEQYCLLRDDLQFDLCPIQCQVCLRSHNFMDCPVVFYSPSRGKIAIDKGQNINQVRHNLHERKKKKSKNSYFNMVEKIELALDLQLENGLLQQEQINSHYILDLGLPTAMDDFSIDSLTKRKQQNVVDQFRLSKVKQLINQGKLLKLERIPQVINDLYSDFLNIKKESLDNFDKKANLQHYHIDDNVLNVLKNFTNREYKVVNRRVNRMKTFYRRGQHSKT